MNIFSLWVSSEGRSAHNVWEGEHGEAWGPGQCPPPGGHKSLLKKSVSHCKKESVSHYTPPGDGGVCWGSVRRKSIFSKALLGKKALTNSIPKVSQSLSGGVGGH